MASEQDDQDPAGRDRDAGERYERDESDAQRLDRNYSELLQELRVAQTGVQILFAFLLTIAFQQRFPTINTFQRDVYLATLMSAAVAAVLLISPVAAHRVMFGQRMKDRLVALTGRVAATGLFFLGVAIVGAVLLIVDIVAGATASIVLTIALALLVAWLWYVRPAQWRSASLRSRGPAVQEEKPG